MEDIGLLRKEEALCQILNLIFKNLDDISWNFRVNFFWRKMMHEDPPDDSVVFDPLTF